MRSFSIALVALAGMGIGTADAAFISRASGQAYYDTDLGITWVADANLAMTSGWDADGQMSWVGAQAWVAHLNAISYLGVTNWRLPGTSQPDTSCSTVIATGQYGGPNCTGSEMGHMYYIGLGGVAGQTLASTHNANYNLFTNIQAANYYSETVYALNTNAHWDFNFLNGFQGVTTSTGFRAWAVSGGDATVPLPAAMWLFGSALALLGLQRKRAENRQA
jgi:Protein of unknown function (DUF1566)